MRSNRNYDNRDNLGVLNDARSYNENDGSTSPLPIVPVGWVETDFSGFAGQAGYSVFDGRSSMWRFRF